MTYREWAERPDLIAGLRVLLSEPVMQTALDVLIDSGLPKSRFPANTPNLLENNALLNAKREGYFEFLKNLKALAVEKQKSPDETGMAPWKYMSEQNED